MQLILNDESTIPVLIDDSVREAWLLQYERAIQAGELDRLAERIGQCFGSSLAECLDGDLKPPTAAQLQYATSIARELGVPLPYEALRFRGSMAEFIDRFAESLKQKRRGYRKS